MSRFFSGFFFWLHFYSGLRHRSRKEEEFSSFEVFFHFCFFNNDEVFPHRFYDNESIYASVFWQTEKYFSVERRFSICFDERNWSLIFGLKLFLVSQRRFFNRSTCDWLVSTIKLLNFIKKRSEDFQVLKRP